MGLTDFPPELLIKIFLKLSYKSLLSVTEVSSQWNAIVAKDPALGVLMFKKPSEVYIEPACFEPFQSVHESTEKDSCAPGSEPIMLHPAVQSASYPLGDDADSVRFWTSNYEPTLPELAIADDFMSIPMVKMVKVIIPQRCRSSRRLELKIQNPAGVKLIDFFAGIESELAKPSRYSSPSGDLPKSEVLGENV
ncbi:hypothetical protein C8R43DRAFT_969175 [Mycena crocata]|nr:hypothetical protein C8R43DRAFT_969175 [Mycena crocata]